MIEAVIFDLDDTLYDEADYCRSGFSAAASFIANQLSNCPTEKIFDLMWQEFSRGNTKKVFDTVLNKMQINYSPEIIRELVDLYKAHKPDISLPNDSRSILDLLSKKYVLGLLTDGFLPAQRLKVQSLNIEKYFKCIIYTEELGRDFWKPSKVPFEKMLKSLQVSANKSVYIADNVEKDFIGPNILGMHSVQIKRANSVHNKQKTDKKAAAEIYIDNFLELPSIIRRL